MTDLDALDRKAAEALGWKWGELLMVDGGPTNPGIFCGPRENYYPDRFSPATIPAQAMALLERMPNGVLMRGYHEFAGQWSCNSLGSQSGGWSLGDTPCIAITRAFVAWSGSTA